MPLEHKGVRLTYLEHDSFRLEGDGLTVYTDPYMLRGGGLPEADVVTISHDHFDHLSLNDLSKVSSDDTVIVAAENCRGKLSGVRFKEAVFLKPGDSARVKGLEITATHAYNTNKFREPGVPFHPKEYGGLGFVIRFSSCSIYHAGDTDNIPEMSELRGRVSIALLPVSGVYVMTPEEAAEAALRIQPEVAVPMHWGAIVASRREAVRFKELLEGKVRVEVLEKEG